MFKRRKTDGSEAAAPDADAATNDAAAPAAAEWRVGGFPENGDQSVNDAASLAWIPGKASDGGLGVPPFRPAAAKESEYMSRAPLNPVPAAPPVPQAAAPRPPASFSRGAMRESPDRRMLVVGRGISLQGTVQDAERLVVEGTVEASTIQATELSITHGGLFKGEIEVEEAEIAGTMDGTLTVRGALVVRNTGRVLGTARCRRLQVEDGGQITGRVEMLTDTVSRLEAPRLTADSLA